MAHVAPIYPNFARGEVSPLMFGRIDIEQYPSCLDKCRNTYIRPYGCATRLTGTEFVANAKNNGKARLLKFVFSPTDSYIIECGAGYFRFYQNGGAIEKQSADAWVTGTNYVKGDFVSEDGDIYYCLENHTSGTFATDLENNKWVQQDIYEVPNTYSEEQLDSIQYVQLDDIIKLTCLPDSRGNSSAKPKELIRNASDDWTFQDVTFKETPYLDQNTTDITMKASATTGNSITVEASANYFNADMVGTNFWIGTKVTDTDSNKDVQGYVKITGYTDAKHVTAKVESKLSGTTATKLWGEGAFSDYRGYPAVIALFDGRLWYARTPHQPRNVYGSKPYAYETFTPAVDNEDDAGINIALATNANGDGSDIKWMVGASYLLCGTYGGEFVIRSTGDGAITPTDISARQRTNWGGEPVQPIVAGTFVHFLQRNGNKLRQFQYDYYYDAYKAVDVSIFSEHLLESPIKAMALQKNPDSIIYLMREDGNVVMLTLEQDQSVQAWSLLEELGAKVESIQTIPSYDGNFDEVYMIMNRPALHTTLTPSCSNPLVTVTESYTGTKSSVGTYTEILECTTATHYERNTSLTSSYYSTYLDPETGIAEGRFTVSDPQSTRERVTDAVIYFTTGDDITNRQIVALFRDPDNYFSSQFYIKNGKAYFNTVSDHEYGTIEANTTYQLSLSKYSSVVNVALANSGGSTIHSENFANYYYMSMIGGETSYAEHFEGSFDFANSFIKVGGAGGVNTNLAYLTQTLQSETTGEVVDLSDPNYALTVTGNLELGDTITLVYKTEFTGVVRFIERMLNPITPENPNDWWYVRSGLPYDGYKRTEGINLTLTANTGTVTVTASDNIFTESMVGNRIRFIDDDYNILGEGTITEFTSETEVTLDITTTFQSQDLTGGTWGISTDIVSGLDHLNGREVQIYADGKEQAKKTVLDGSIEIDDAFLAVVGLPYTSYITTMPMEAGSQNGTAVGKRKRISEMAIRVWNSLGVKVGRDLDNLYDTIYEQQKPFTGVIPNIKYNQGWVWDANITVEQSHPYPMNILSIAPIVTEVDK